jgi:beta-barrel assembly-enhancing protease
MAVPASFEEKLGDRVIGELGGKRCENAEGKAALERLLARIAGATPIPYEVQIGVLDRPEVNAFAAPGGRIVVFRGLVEGAASPDELAGVLAHELTHALKRHGTQHLVRALGLSLILDVAVGQGTARSFAETGLFLAYSRDFEREADAGAVELLHAAGIDPGALAAFFERTRKSGKGELLPLWLRSHPTDEERAGRILAASRPGSGPALDEAQWQALKRICK